MKNNETCKDIIIIGGGPAGLTAAIYASRSGLDTLVIDNYIAGGQVATSDTVENYPGYFEISGAELSEKIAQQAIKNGADVIQLEEIKSIEASDDIKKIYTSDKTFSAQCLIIASGAAPIPLPIKDEEKFRGRGIHYCAVCDGALYKGKTVAVVGGGNSAVEEAYFLSKLVKQVIMIVRKDSFNAEKRLLDRVQKKSNIKIMYNSEVVEAQGKEKLESIIIKNSKSSNTNSIRIDGIFVYIGSKPNSHLVKDYINTDEKGYIITDEKMMTNIKGVFAAGDIRVKPFRQITTAVSDGTIAALEAERIINR